MMLAFRETRPSDIDSLFETYSELLPTMLDWARERYPKEPGDSDFVYKNTIRGKACDALRGILPAATLSNVGVYGSGQAFEALLLRMRSHPLPTFCSSRQTVLPTPTCMQRFNTRPNKPALWPSP